MLQQVWIDEGKNEKLAKNLWPKNLIHIPSFLRAVLVDCRVTKICLSIASCGHINNMRCPKKRNETVFVFSRITTTKGPLECRVAFAQLSNGFCLAFERLSSGFLRPFPEPRLHFGSTNYYYSPSRKCRGTLVTRMLRNRERRETICFGRPRQF